MRWVANSLSSWTSRFNSCPQRTIKMMFRYIVEKTTEEGKTTRFTGTTDAETKKLAEELTHRTISKLYPGFSLVSLKEDDRSHD